MAFGYYDSHTNTLYINSNIVSPDLSDLSKMPMKSRIALLTRIMKMPINDRIKSYANDAQRKMIQHEMDKHPGCNVVEYIEPRCSI